jgi:hypothetical protein
MHNIRQLYPRVKYREAIYLSRNLEVLSLPDTFAVTVVPSALSCTDDHQMIDMQTRPFF